jgi:hypothetical protein
METGKIFSDLKYKIIIDSLYCNGYDTKSDQIFNRVFSQFKSFIETNLKPFQENPDLFKIYEQLFDSQIIIPLQFKNKFIAAIEKEEYFEALQYSLTISKKQFDFYKQQKKTHYDNKFDQVFLDVKYISRFGLDG